MGGKEGPADQDKKGGRIEGGNGRKGRKGGKKINLKEVRK